MSHCVLLTSHGVYSFDTHFDSIQSVAYRHRISKGTYSIKYPDTPKENDSRVLGPINRYSVPR